MKNNNPNRNILTYGTFDLLHYGHISLLKRAKALGGRLYVGLSTDEFNKKKGKSSFFDYERRRQFLAEIRSVDVIFSENSWEQKAEDIQKYRIDMFVMGSDWQGKFDNLKPYCKVVYLERTKNVSSTLLKQSAVTA